ARDVNRTVNLRGIALAAALGDARTDLVDDDLLPRTDLALQPPCGNLLLVRHQALVALGLDVVRHRAVERIGGCAFDRLILEAADAIDLRLVEPGQQIVELGFGLAVNSDAEGRAQRQLRTGVTPARDARECLVLRGR